MDYTPQDITHISENEVFVFGSNINGRHCSGAARSAFDKFGAIWGKGVGMQGNSYAIPTMEGDMEVLRAYINDFVEFARTHPKLRFLVTRVGCGIAGYKDSQIAPMFWKALALQNVVLPKSFVEVLQPCQKNTNAVPYPYVGMKYCMDMVFHLSFHKVLTQHDFVFFWKDEDDKPYVSEKCLSQWYYAPFMVNNQWYSCAEQYMMAEKACLFGDYDIYQQILNQSDQMAIKKLGRMVHNFKEDIWQQHRSEIIKRANMAKFSQNKSLMDFLLSTGDRILVKASPYDVIYGVGIEEHNPNILDPHKWRGLNLLGFTLMEIRDMLGE